MIDACITRGEPETVRVPALECGLDTAQQQEALNALILPIAKAQRPPLSRVVDESPEMQQIRDRIRGYEQRGTNTSLQRAKELRGILQLMQDNAAGDRYIDDLERSLDLERATNRDLASQLARQEVSLECYGWCNEERLRLTADVARLTTERDGWRGRVAELGGAY